VQTKKVDVVEPVGRWRFDGDVTDSFDDMLQRSIPQYEVMRKAVFDLACEFQRDKTYFLDLGSSRGESIAPIIEKFGALNHYYLTEISDPMLDVLRERFASWEYSGRVTIRKCDLRNEFPNVQTCVVLSVLTLMFIPLECRQALIQNVYDSLLPGGAFICVEKVLGASAGLETVLSKLYRQKKTESGYSAESIERKRLSLQGVLVPVTASWESELLYMAGFRQVECFWRWMNFAGWIAVKSG